MATATEPNTTVDVEIVYENDEIETHPQTDVIPKDSTQNEENKENNNKDTNNDQNGENVQTKNSEIISSLETETTENQSDTKQKLQLLMKHHPEYFVLSLAIFSLIMSIVILLGVYGSLKSKMSAKQQQYNDALSSKLHYESTDIMDESQIIYVGNYYGWSYANYRNAAYRSNKNDYQSGNDVQYPLPDIHVRYGDKLIFKRIDASLKDDLVLVDEDLYNSCDFSKYANSDGDILDSAEILLASEKDLYSEDGTVEYIIDINSSLPTSLLFTSTYKWDAKNGGSCLGGLKVKIIIDKSYRDSMPVKRSSDKWRGISSTTSVINLDASIGHVSRQLTLQHFSHEQRIRSNGDSGISNVRGIYSGEVYDNQKYNNYGSGSIHDHSDHLRVIGISEIEAVLNGVEFQTKHIDYYLNMPSLKSYEYNEIEEIEFPDVPDAVKKAGSVDNQIVEMQEWFRAFKNQDKSERNYTKYFKPILCYLEGTWILSDEDENDENNYYNNNNQMRWMSNNGRKNLNENLSHLPSSIRNLQNNTYPIISNWDYRVICHPLKNDVPTSRFRVHNDLSIQLYGSPKTISELYFDKKTRFDLNKYINIDDINNDNQWTTSRYQWNYLDYLMEQIPGKDNYIGNVSDQLPDGSGPILHSVTNEWINSGYYSRYYKLSEGDAMGSTGHRRSYSDRNLFAAKTTQINVSPIQMLFEVQNDTTDEINFYPTISRWSYAIPLEIIYLTPLTKWNPYNIKEKNMKDFDYNKNGKCTNSDAYNGYTIDKAYFTPSKFYSELYRDNICSIGGDGKMYNVEASGHYIILPEIGGNVGKVRQRYPIFPIHNGGSSPYKELKALQAVALSATYENDNNDLFGENKDLIYGVLLNLNGGGHNHIMYISPSKIKNKWYNSINQEWLMSSDNIIEVETNAINNHQHTLTIWRTKNTNNIWEYHIKQCRYGTLFDNINEWIDNECYDYHNRIVA